MEGGVDGGDGVCWWSLTCGLDRPSEIVSPNKGEEFLRKENNQNHRNRCGFQTVPSTVSDCSRRYFINTNSTSSSSNLVAYMVLWFSLILDCSCFYLFSMNRSMKSKIFHNCI